MGAPMRHFFMGLLHGASGASVYGSFARLLINGFPLACLLHFMCNLCSRDVKSNNIQNAGMDGIIRVTPFMEMCLLVCSL